MRNHFAATFALPAKLWRFGARVCERNFLAAAEPPIFEYHCKVLRHSLEKAYLSEQSMTDVYSEE